MSSRRRARRSSLRLLRSLPKTNPSWWTVAALVVVAALVAASRTLR